MNDYPCSRIQYASRAVMCTVLQTNKNYFHTRFTHVPLTGNCTQSPTTRKKWICYGNKIRDNKYFFLLLQPKILLPQPNVLMIELNILLLLIFFVVPILTNDFVGITKPFIPCDRKPSI